MEKEQDGSRTGCWVVLAGMIGLVLVLAGVGIGWLLVSGTPMAAGPLAPSNRAPIVPVSTGVVAVAPDPALVLLTPKATFTPLPPTTATPTFRVGSEATPTAGPTQPQEGVVLFRVQAERLELYEGAGDANPILGSVVSGTVLPVVGRTADGAWWMVCCIEGESGWMRLEERNVLVEGDVGTVNVLDVPVQSQSSATPAASLTGGAGVRQPAAQATTFEPARNLDVRLPDLGVAIEPANAAPGQPYWRVVEILWHDEAQSGGRHALWVEVVDEEGKRVVGQPLTVSWAEGTQQLVVEDRLLPEYGSSFPMYAAGQAYTVRVDGLPSEQVHGLGLGEPTRRDTRVPVEYLIRFQRAVR